MDWATFLKDNSQALFTLGGVFLGSLITFAINYLNNRFQARENDKERLEKRREAKAQLALDLMRNDIKRIEDVTDAAFEFFNIVKLLAMRRDMGFITRDEWDAEFQSMFTSNEGKFAKLAELDSITLVLVYTLGNEIYAEYNGLGALITEYIKVLSDPSATGEEREAVSDKLVSAAGNVQKMLREKLISIRDTES